MSATAEAPRVEVSQKRVRTMFGGETIADTTRAQLVWEVPYYPAYYLPRDDVCGEFIMPNGRTRSSPYGLGAAELFDVVAGGRSASDAAWCHVEPPVAVLRGLIRFEWNAMDRWLEEDEEVIVHPRSPYTRVDVLPSSRHIEVVIDEVKLADTHRAMALHETGRPVRWYLPRADIRMDLLTPTPTRTGCPYKGWATYWSVDTGKLSVDVAWSYPRPLPESARIADLICIWDHNVETIIDGITDAIPPWGGRLMEVPSAMSTV